MARRQATCRALRFSRFVRRTLHRITAPSAENQKTSAAMKRTISYLVSSTFARVTLRLRVLRTVWPLPLLVRYFATRNTL
jgi:hypothetical protein